MSLILKHYSLCCSFTHFNVMKQLYQTLKASYKTLLVTTLLAGYGIGYAPFKSVMVAILSLISLLYYTRQRCIRCNQITLSCNRCIHCLVVFCDVCKNIYMRPEKVGPPPPGPQTGVHGPRGDCCANCYYARAWIYFRLLLLRTRLKSTLNNVPSDLTKICSSYVQ